MYVLKIVFKILFAYLAVSLIVGSVSVDFGTQLARPQRFGLCLITFCSVVLLHFLIWQFIVGKFTILGREPTSFIEFGRSKTFFSGLTFFGYISLAIYYVKIAVSQALTDPIVLGDSERIYGLTFGLILIGMGLAARLRVLLHNPQIIPNEIGLYRSQDESISRSCRSFEPSGMSSSANIFAFTT